MEPGLDEDDEKEDDDTKEEDEGTKEDDDKKKDEVKEEDSEKKVKKTELGADKLAVSHLWLCSFVHSIFVAQYRYFILF